PAIIAQFQEVIEPAGADNVAELAFYRGTLADGHLRLRDCAVTVHVDRNPAQEVEDANTLLEAFLAYRDELLGWTLEPCGHHASVIVPYAAETFPVAGVAPDDPVFQQFTNFAAILFRC